MENKKTKASCLFDKKFIKKVNFVRKLFNAQSVEVVDIRLLRNNDWRKKRYEQNQLQRS